MYARQVKRKCMVRGCRSVDTFAVSKTREGGSSVIICKDCLEKALKAVENYDPSMSQAKMMSAPPELFFMSAVEGKPEDAAGRGELPNLTPDLSAKPFVCNRCGKEYKTQNGLEAHTCKGERA